jgi:hypothetical protein
VHPATRFVQSIKALQLHIAAPVPTTISCIEVALTIAFTKALRSSTFITKDHITSIRRHQPRLCPHIQMVFVAGRLIDHGNGAQGLPPRHEERSAAWHFPIERRNTT